MRALVTGVAGFIGSHLAERLVDSGASVVGIDSFTTSYDPEVKRTNVQRLVGSERFQLVEGDLRELDLGESLADVDVVYHLAARPGVRRGWGREFEVYLTENVLVLQLLLQAATNAKIGRLVFASSSSIYGDAETMPTPETAAPRPVSPYGVTKLAGEHLCYLYSSRFGVPIVILRYFAVYGPRQRPDMAFTQFMEAAGADQEIEVFGDGLQSRDFTYVDDAVAATMAAGSTGRPGAVYNVAGGSQATVGDVIASLEELLGRSLKVRYLPPVPGDARHTSADITSAQRDLGYAPSITLNEGLAMQLRAQLP
jgi:nucleoside-diphosphate-sugar epimerase